MFTTDIFNRVEQLLDEDSVDIAIYDGEFFDPDRLAALQHRYSTKDGYMIDIGNIETLETDQTGIAPKVRVNIVIYCAHANRRTVDLKVKGSVALSVQAMKRLAGQQLEAGDDHNAGFFLYGDTVKEDQIPYISVHAVRFIIDLVLDLTK